MKSTRKFSKVLSLALALVLALALFPTAVFAADTEVTVKGPDGIDLNGSTVNAYQLLEPVTGNAGVYQETAVWETFFANVHGLKSGDHFMYYDKDNDELGIDTNPGPGVELVDFQLNSDLDANYPVNDFLDRLRGNTEALTAIGTWARQNANENSFAKDATADFPAASGTPVVSSVTLTLDSEGYYLLATESLPAGVVSLSSVLQLANTTEITLKAQPYDLEKEAQAPAGTQVGSEVPYTITMPLPESTTSKTIESAVLTDTVTGADYNQDSFVLTIGQDVYVSGTPAGAQKDLKDVATLTYSGTNNRSFTLTFTDAGLAALNALAAGKTDAEAVLTYNVTVASDGVYVVENDATINIKHGPDQITDTTDDSTKVYLYGVQLQKEFSDGSMDYSNVKFELYDSTGENKINVTGSNGAYKIADANDTVETDMTLATDGTLKITGLGATTYVLKETSTAGGFNTANATIRLVADADNPGQLKNDGSCTVTIDNNAQANATVVTDGVNENVLVTFDFLNQKGFTLPSTGGAGTWMFTLGGLALIAIAGTALYVSKKKVTE